ncbi:LPXTG cell wall anchor domain-containing protein [Streptomyces sp. NPDC006487]|uniref:LPXTG cell wall anchor domain-containing protein n=1 Tax=unclassified Streptomyces TaxID=2593676 RepID=UPI002E1137A3|nr:LPXTG cell wall anchor domain-containing protein [Streptomyces sp. NBC_01244]
MSARRSTLTALGATTLLAALWFVPSAGATAPEHAKAASGAPAAANTRVQAASAPGPALELADTGGVDTTPYLLGGTLFLGAGAGFVAFSVRRSRTA